MKLSKRIISLLLVLVMMVGSFGAVNTLALGESDEVFTFTPADAKVHEGSPKLEANKISWVGNGNSHDGTGGNHSVYFTIENATGGIYDVAFDAPQAQGVRYVDIIVGSDTYSIRLDNATGTLYVPDVELEPGENKIIYACHQGGQWAPDITGLQVKKVRECITFTPADAKAEAGNPLIGKDKISWLGNGGAHDGIAGPHSVYFMMNAEGGSYDLQFVLPTAYQNRAIDVTVGGVTYTGGGNGWQNLILVENVTLAAGKNKIVVGNNSGWAPDISVMRVEKLGDADKVLYPQDFDTSNLPAGDYCAEKENDTFELAGDRTPSFFAEPGQNSTLVIGFDVPEGAVSFTGTVGMCDQALTTNYNNKNNTVWFAVDGENQAIVGPIRTTDDPDTEHHSGGFHDFNITLPEGAKQLTVYVNNPDSVHKDHVIFFDTTFNMVSDVTPSDAALAVDRQIVAIKDNYKYNYRGELLAAKAAFDQLTAEQQLEVNGAYWLSEALAASDAALAADAKFILAESKPGESGLTNGWLATISDADWQATRDAVADAIKYQRVMNNRNVSDGNNGGLDNWMTSFWYVALGGSDNLNKQDWKANWTILSMPFPGTAFVVDTFFAQNYQFQDALPLGEFFEYDGRVYQLFWNGTWSHEIAMPSSTAEMVGVSRENKFPDERATDGETNKNIFRYAYATYSQNNRWDGRTLGLPTTAKSIAYGDNRVQEFIGPNGTAYLITTTDLIEAAPTDISAADYAADMDASYFVVTGQLAEVLKSDTDVFARGGKVLAVNDTQIVFANGSLTLDGFDVNSESAKQAAAVDAAIEALGEITSLEQAEAVAAVRAMYEELSNDVKQLVSKIRALETAEAAIKLLADTAAADAVDAMIIAFGEITSLAQAEAVAEARSAYEALTADQQALVDGLAALRAAERAIEDLQNAADADAVVALIEALGEITSLDQEADVAAARAAYDGLIFAQKILIDKETVEKLEAAEADIEALKNSDIPTPPVDETTPGDVDKSGTVDVADIMKLKALIMADKWSQEELTIGDLDESDSLDVGDIMAVKTRIMSAI